MTDVWVDLTLLTWVAAIVWLAMVSRASHQSAGLPLCYLLTLAVIYLPGVVTSYFTDGHAPSLAHTQLGFPITQYAIVGFVVGNRVTAALLKRPATSNLVPQAGIP